MKRLMVVIAVAAVFAFALSVSSVLAQPVDYCEGNFDNDLDQDGTDAFVFKQDFGRSSLLDPCPVDRVVRPPNSWKRGLCSLKLVASNCIAGKCNQSRQCRDRIR